jgi:hypothetical protein
VAFTRESLKDYESKAAAAAIEPTPAEPVAIEPAEIQTEAPSASAETPPVEPASDDTSAANAEPATATAEPAGETSPELEATPPKKGDARERIEGLIVERDALRKYGEFLLEQNAALRGKAPVETAAPAVETVADEEPPTMEAHNYDPIAYTKAQNAWLKKQVEKRVNAALTQARGEQSAAEAAAKFQERSDDFAKANPTFKTVVANPALPPLSQPAAKALVLSEHGPAIHFHIASHPDLAARIARMPIEQQLVQIGRIEILVSQASAPTETKPAAPKQKSVTKAPAPPTPVPAGTSPANKRMEDMTMDEWVAHDRAQKIAQKQQRQKLRAAMR